MRARTLKYFIQEGIRSFFKNGLMSVASVITVMLCLILFGVYVLFSMNLNYAAAQVEANYEITVFIEEDTSLTRTSQISENLKALSNINNVIFVSKEQALEGWKKEFGEGAEILDGLEHDNPLRDSYKVTVLDLKVVNTTVSEIEKMDNVAYVKNNKDTMDRLVNITGIVKNISLWFMVFFALISIFIISNAIRITVFARRREVNIMKFVGATDWFISFPFMIEGIIIGILGALFSVFAVSQAYNYFFNYADLIFGSTIKLYQFHTVFWVLVASLVGMGVTLGAVGSAISLRRHLHV